MKMQDVIEILQKSLPNQTDLFSSSSVITDVTVLPGSLVFMTDAPDIDIGDTVCVKDILNGIEVSELIDDGLNKKVLTNTDHGLCDEDINNEKLLFEQGGSVYLAKLIAVMSPTEIIVRFDDVVNASLGQFYLTTTQGFNGYYVVTEIEAGVSFTTGKIQNQFTPPMIALSDGILNTKVRIAGAADMERFNAAYTKQDVNDCWLVVVPPENRASRSREVTTDAISGFGDSDAYAGPVELRQTHVERLTLYVVIPSRFELAGRSAVDMAETIRWALYRCLVGNPIPTEAKNGYITATVPVNDGYFSYLSDNTTYTHEYVFERSVMVESDDGYDGDDQTAPFRGLELELIPCDHDNM